MQNSEYDIFLPQASILIVELGATAVQGELTISKIRPRPFLSVPRYSYYIEEISGYRVQSFIVRMNR